MNASKAIKLRQEAKRKKLMAPSYDPIRAHFDTSVANNMLLESAELIKPYTPLNKGSGGEIVPPYDFGMSGLELALKEPDLLDAEVTIKRTDLAEKAGVFEMAIVNIVESGLISVCEPCCWGEMEIRCRVTRQFLVMVILEKGCHSALASM